MEGLLSYAVHIKYFCFLQRKEKTLTCTRDKIINLRGELYGYYTIRTTTKNNQGTYIEVGVTPQKIVWLVDMRDGTLKSFTVSNNISEK